MCDEAERARFAAVEDPHGILLSGEIENEAAGRHPRHLPAICRARGISNPIRGMHETVALARP